MSIAELIMTGTERASKSTDWVADSLAKIGQNVGQALAQREQQKQAQEMLPFLQQSMQESMTLAGQGKTGEAYAKLMPFLADPAVINNPNLRQVIPAFESGIKIAGDEFYKKEQLRVREDMYNARYGGGGGGGGGGEGFGPTRRDVARSILLGEGPLPQDQEPVSKDSINIEGELPEMAGVGDPTQPDPSVTLLDIANVANSPKFTRALIEKAKNPPNQTTLDDVRAAANDYFAKSEEERKTVVDSLTLNFPNKQQLDSSVKKEDRLKIDGANRILGKGYEGLVLQPAEEISSVTIGASGIPSETYKTNKDTLNKFGTTFAGAVEELNQGSIGNFIANAGGVFNVEKEPVEEEDESGEIKQVTYFINKRNKKNRIKIPTGKAGEAQLLAFDLLKASPAELSVFRNQGSTAGFYSFPTKTTAGPRKEFAPPKPTEAPSPKDQQALEWATANPNDPRAKQIKQKLGI
jgi:hypothetical protein